MCQAELDERPLQRLAKIGDKEKRDGQNQKQKAHEARFAHGFLRFEIAAGRGADIRARLKIRSTTMAYPILPIINPPVADLPALPGRSSSGE